MSEITSMLGGIIFSPHGEFNIGASMLSPDDCPLVPMTASSAACLTAISATTPANNNSHEHHLLNATTTQNHNDHKTPVLRSLLKSTGDDDDDVEDNCEPPSAAVQPSSQSFSSLLSSLQRHKKRPREDSVSSFDGKPLYRVVAGKRYPLHPHAIRLIEQVVNQGNKNVLDLALPNEAENERKMRLHLSHRYSAISDENHNASSLIDFTHKLMQLWGGRLEMRNEHKPLFPSTASTTASTIKAENSTRRISFKPSPPPSSAAAETTALRSQTSTLNSRVSPLIRRTSPRDMTMASSVLSSTSPALHRFDDLEEDDLMSGLDFLDDAATFGDTLSSAVKSTTKPPANGGCAPLSASSSSWPKRKKDPSRRVTYHGDEATLPQMGGKENHYAVGQTASSGSGGLYSGGFQPLPMAAFSDKKLRLDDATPVNVSSNTIEPSTPASGLKRGVRWDAGERKLFLHGLEKFGAGNWKEIHKLIPGRTYVQVKSMGVYLVSKFHMSRGQGPSKLVTDYLIGSKPGKNQQH